MKRPAAALLALVVAWACRDPRPPPRQPQVSAAPAVITDDEGVEHPVGSPPQIIVSLAPHLTEALFALGAGDKVAGVSPGETHPPEATALPVVTLPGSPEPDTARIEQLRPGLVVTAGSPGAAWKAQLRKAGIAVATFNAGGIHDAIADIASLAQLTGASGEKLTRRLKQEVEAAAKKPAVRVFVEAFYPPLTGAGRGGFVEDLIAMAGGILIAPDAPSETFEWTAAMVAAEGPGLYIAPFSTGPNEKSIRDRPGFAALQSVRIAVVHDDLLFRPGPRMSQALRHLGSLIGRRA